MFKGNIYVCTPGACEDISYSQWMFWGTFTYVLLEHARTHLIASGCFGEHLLVYSWSMRGHIL